MSSMICRPRSGMESIYATPGAVSVLKHKQTNIFKQEEHDMKGRRNQAFVAAEECACQNQGGGVKRKILAYGDDLMQVEVHFEKGAVGAMHAHPHTQLTHVLEGEFEFTIGNEKKIVKRGDTLYKVPNVQHGCVCLKEGVLLDTFNPCREDFLE